MTNMILPEPDVAIQMAEEYEEWAGAANEIDRHGTARLYEMVSLLLKYYAKNEKELRYDHEEENR